MMITDLLGLNLICGLVLLCASLSVMPEDIAKDRFLVQFTVAACIVCGIFALPLLLACVAGEVHLRRRLSH